MKQRHTAETLGATFILLVCGSALTYLSRRWGIGSDLPTQFAAFAGPVGVVLGIGAALHGRAMPPSHITPAARAWGVLGSLAATANVASLGFFERGGAVGTARWLLPTGLILAWFLPRRFYGEQAVEGSALAGLLNALEEVGEAHPELFDTDVREGMWEVVHRRYLEADAAYEVPADLGMFSSEGNARLRAVLQQHLENMARSAQTDGLDTAAKRLRSIQEEPVKSAQGALSYDAFFGSP